MNNKVFSFIIAVILGCSLFTYCSKKTVKVSPPESVPVRNAAKPLTAAKTAVSRETVNDAAIREALAPVYFEFDRYDLPASEIPKLERIASLLMKSPDIRLMCEGHCDERGTQEYNMGLGDNRAHAVKKWLAAYGINDLNIETTSYGKERPVIADCPDESCHAKNRRVEWKVLER